jgi:hypothetical protein
MKYSTIIIIIFTILAALGLVYYCYFVNLPENQNQIQQITPTDTAKDEADVRQLVENFGLTLQQVNLFSPDASSEMDRYYAELVDPSLLTDWKADPSKAPGRFTSSPWPDRIEIDSVQMDSADSYTVAGKIIEVTSAEEGTDNAAATREITLTVERSSSKWLITDVSMGTEGSQTTTKPGSSGGVSFQYPESLQAKYISTNQWPPEMKLSAGNYSCAVSTGTGGRALVAQKVVNGRIYCIETKNGGAAGSTYSTYTYTTPKNGKLLTLTFILQYPQCANYTETESATCTAERDAFDLDSIIDGIVQTATWDTTSDTSDAIKLQKCLPSSDTASQTACNAILSKINSFTTCVMDGFTVTDTTPPQCDATNGKSFKQ